MATVFTDAGKAITTDRVKNGDTGATEPEYVAWGTGAGTAVVANTTLFTEASEARVAGTTTQETTTVTSDTYQVVGTITADGTKTITNAGLFDASTVGNLYMKGDFTGVPLALNDAIQFTMSVQYTD
jgi:hypothetical protein